MARLVYVDSPEEQARFCSLPGPGAPTPAAAPRPLPDARWLVEDGAGAVMARCSLWWSGTPDLPGHRTGLIGHYAAVGAGAAAHLLQHACHVLRTAGCTLAIGPMDGSTWRHYRLVTERGDEPPFFLEPDNPDSYPAHFVGSGFATLTHYFSTCTDDLAAGDPRLPEIARSVAERGIAIRSLDRERFSAELERIYRLALASFRENFLYTPIDAAGFLDLYRPMERYLVPELVLLAEHGNDLAGFALALPDLLQAQRGRPVDTLIVKTLAVHPAYGGIGLGGLLVARCHEAGRKLGFRRAIHALMHETNRSGRISAHYGRPIRRYALFSRPLGDMP